MIRPAYDNERSETGPLLAELKAKMFAESSANIPTSVVDLAQKLEQKLAEPKLTTNEIRRPQK